MRRSRSAASFRSFRAFSTASGVASIFSTGNSGSLVVVAVDVEAVVSVADVVVASFGLHAARAITRNTTQTTRKRDLMVFPPLSEFRYWSRGTHKAPPPD